MMNKTLLGAIATAIVLSISGMPVFADGHERRDYVGYYLDPEGLEACIKDPKCGPYIMGAMYSLSIDAGRSSLGKFENKMLATADGTAGYFIDEESYLKCLKTPGCNPLVANVVEGALINVTAVPKLEAAQKIRIVVPNPIFDPGWIDPINPDYQ